jgi:hypothetical protein
MRKAGFWFTLWAQWTSLYMSFEEFTAWLEHKGYRLARDENGAVVLRKYLPEWWYLLGGGRGSPNTSASKEPT